MLLVDPERQVDRFKRDQRTRGGLEESNKLGISRRSSNRSPVGGIKVRFRRALNELGSRCSLYFTAVRLQIRDNQSV